VILLRVLVSAHNVIVQHGLKIPTLFLASLEKVLASVQSCSSPATARKIIVAGNFSLLNTARIPG